MGVVLTQTNRGTSVYEVCPEFMFPQYLLSGVVEPTILSSILLLDLVGCIDGYLVLIHIDAYLSLIFMSKITIQFVSQP